MTGQVENLDTDSLSKQLTGVSGIFKYCPKDLRIFTSATFETDRKLEGKSLVEGLNLILKELSDKSDIEVKFSP